MRDLAVETLLDLDDAMGTALRRAHVLRIVTEHHLHSSEAVPLSPFEKNIIMEALFLMMNAMTELHDDFHETIERVKDEGAAT